MGILLTTIGTNELAIGLAIISLIGTVVGLIFNTVQAHMNNKRDVKLAVIKADAEDQKDEIDDMAKELETAKETIKALELRIEQGDKEHKKMIEENGKLKQRVLKLEGTIKAMTNELEEKKKEIERLSGEG